jgi:hypothetical protein
VSTATVSGLFDLDRAKSLVWAGPARLNVGGPRRRANLSWMIIVVLLDMALVVLAATFSGPEAAALTGATVLAVSALWPRPHRVS